MIADEYEHKKAELALRFLEIFYLSDISDELREKARSVLMNYFDD